MSFNFAKADTSCTVDGQDGTCLKGPVGLDGGSECPGVGTCTTGSSVCCITSPCERLNEGYSCVTSFEGQTCTPKSFCVGEEPKCCRPTPPQTPASTQTETVKDVGGTNLFAGVTASCTPKQDSPGECETKDFIIVAMNVANLLLGIIAALALLFFIVAGIKMVISRGNSEQISSAKSMMLNSVIGIVIALCSFLIVRFVQDTIGLKETIDGQQIKIQNTINPR